jgi:hypothetical protein
MSDLEWMQLPMSRMENKMPQALWGQIVGKA